MSNEKFSALVTVYYKDSPLYLDQALNSVFDQTLTPNEVVILADGTLTDPLYKVIQSYVEKYPDLIKTVFLPQNIGTGLAINDGLRNCSYDLVAKIDSDDICFRSRFEKQIEIFKNNPELSFVSAFVAEFINEDINQVVSFRCLPEHNQDIVKYGKKRCPMNQPVIMYRKSAIIDCGGYNNFVFGEDYDLWVRAIIKGYKFYNIQEPLLYFRSNLDSIKKRGGWWYLKIDLSHHYDFYKIGYLSFSEFLYNSSIRIVVRLIPLKLRKFFYSKFLRSKNK